MGSLRQIMRGLSLMLIALALPGCTFVHYTNPETSLTVIDVHPAGESITLDGVLTDKGALSVNRETGDSQQSVETVVERLIP